jgi:hypothetical protein
MSVRRCVLFPDTVDMPSASDTPPSDSFLEVICHFPNAIPFGKSAFGREYRTSIGGRPITLALSRFRKVGDGYRAVPPKVYSVRADANWESYLDRADPWGRVTAWRPKPPRQGIITAHISHAVIRAELPSASTDQRVADISVRLAADMRDWWTLIKDWFEVATGTLLANSLDVPENINLVHNTRVWAAPWRSDNPGSDPNPIHDRRRILCRPHHG